LLERKKAKSSRWVRLNGQLCKEHNVLWVLDPVAAGFTSLRTAVAIELLDIHPPAAIRGNGSEINALAAATLGSACDGGKGVDSTQASDAALEPAKAIAKKYGCIVCVSGAVDYIVGQDGTVGTCPHGVEMLTKVTAAGCLLSSLMAAFIAVRPESVSIHEAATLCCTFYGLSAEVAAKQSSGPGSFRVQLLDALYSIKDSASCGIPVRSVLQA